jgi:hypothetical protein
MLGNSSKLSRATSNPSQVTFQTIEYEKSEQIWKRRTFGKFYWELNSLTIN